MMKRIRNLGLFAAVCAFGGFLVVGGVLSYQQARVLVHLPSGVIRAQSFPDGLPDVRDVGFVTADDLMLYGWYVPPANSPGAVILFIHGHAGNRRHFIDEARILTAAGYGVLMFDLRNHGASEGDITTMGLHEVRDVEAAFAFLSAQPQVDADRIALYGHSMGGATAILAMDAIPQARALVVDTAYTSLFRVASDGVEIRTGFPAFPWGQLIVFFADRLSGASISSVRPVDVVAHVAPRPVLFMHGASDLIIPVEHSQRLFDAAGEPKSLWILDGGRHGNLYERAPDEWAAQVLPFLAAALAGDG